MWKGIFLIWRIFMMRITPSFLRKRRIKSWKTKGMRKIELWDLKGLTRRSGTSFPVSTRDVKDACEQARTVDDSHQHLAAISDCLKLSKHFAPWRNDLY